VLVTNALLSEYDEKLHDSEQMSKFSPPINKAGKLLRPSIVPIIGQTKSPIPDSLCY
jgi:hypothetical protein